MKALLKEMGRTQRWLAEELNICLSSVNKALNGSGSARVTAAIEDYLSHIIEVQASMRGEGIIEEATEELQEEIFMIKDVKSTRRKSILKSMDYSEVFSLFAERPDNPESDFVTYDESGKVTTAYGFSIGSKPWEDTEGFISNLVKSNVQVFYKEYGQSVINKLMVAKTSESKQTLELIAKQYLDDTRCSSGWTKRSRDEWIYVKIQESFLRDNGELGWKNMRGESIKTPLASDDTFPGATKEAQTEFNVIERDSTGRQVGVSKGMSTHLLLNIDFIREAIQESVCLEMDGKYYRAILYNANLHRVENVGVAREEHKLNAFEDRFFVDYAEMSDGILVRRPSVDKVFDSPAAVESERQAKAEIQFGGAEEVYTSSVALHYSECERRDLELSNDKADDAFALSERTVEITKKNKRSKALNDVYRLVMDNVEAARAIYFIAEHIEKNEISEAKRLVYLSREYAVAMTELCKKLTSAYRLLEEIDTNEMFLQDKQVYFMISRSATQQTRKETSYDEEGVEWIRKINKATVDGDTESGRAMASIVARDVEILKKIVDTCLVAKNNKDWSLTIRDKAIYKELKSLYDVAV